MNLLNVELSAKNELRIKFHRKIQFSQMIEIVFSLSKNLEYLGGQIKKIKLIFENKLRRTRNANGESLNPVLRKNAS